jgi:hypothetical protein
MLRRLNGVDSELLLKDGYTDGDVAEIERKMQEAGFWPVKRKREGREMQMLDQYSGTEATKRWWRRQCYIWTVREFSIGKGFTVMVNP